MFCKIINITHRITLFWIVKVIYLIIFKKNICGNRKVSYLYSNKLSTGKRVTNIFLQLRIYGEHCLATIWFELNIEIFRTWSLLLRTSSISYTTWAGTCPPDSLYTYFTKSIYIFVLDIKRISVLTRAFTTV